MAIYGLDLYAKAYYGVDIPIQFSVQPFIANQFEHNNLQISWSTPQQVSSPEAPGKSWSSLRLIRNLYGFSVDEEDGAVLLELPNTSPQENYVDTTVPPGQFVYYTIFVLTTHDAWDATRTYGVGDQVTYESEDWIAIAASSNQAPGTGSAWSMTTTATEWVYAGACVGLSVVDWQYSQFLYDKTPQAYKVSVVETTTSNPDFNIPLYQFDQVFGFGFDIMKTENDALLQINNIELTRDKFIQCMAEQMGIGEEMPDEPLLRRLRIMDGVNIARQRGSIPAIETLVYDTTGWGAEITQGYNVLLNMDQAAWAHPVLPVWDPTVRYAAATNIQFEGAPYESLIANNGHVPDPTVVGVKPSAATPEFWRPEKFLLVGFRGWWSSVTDYAIGDVVVYGTANTFYDATSATGPDHGGAVTPGSGGPWFGNGNMTDSTGAVVVASGVWNSTTNYAVNNLVMDSISTNPNSAAWAATAASSGTTNNYWSKYSGGSYEDTTTLLNPTTRGMSTWVGTVNNTSSPMWVQVNGIPAAGDNPARNCAVLNNSIGVAGFANATSVSTTYFAVWSSSTAYVEGNVVTNGGASYICILNVGPSATLPSNDIPHWKPYAPGPTEDLAIQEGVPIPQVRAWDYQRVYNPGEQVSVNGNIYEATQISSDASPSGYRKDSRGWRWIGPEQALYTASAYYQRQSPTLTTLAQAAINWFGPTNNLLNGGVPLEAYLYPTLFDRFDVDGPIGGTAPSSYPVIPAYGNPVPITWISEGGPWNVDYGFVHTVYPATYAAGQLLVMSEGVYGASITSRILYLFGTLVRQSFDPNRETGMVFNLDPVARTYWMASRTRLTKNTYAADFSTVSITQVTTWPELPDNSRLTISRTGTNFNANANQGTPFGTTLFAVNDSFSTTGTLHGFGERPMS